MSLASSPVHACLSQVISQPLSRPVCLAVMQPKPFVEKGISLYLWAWALCHPDLGMAAPDGWLVTTVRMSLWETVKEVLVCVCDLRSAWLREDESDSLYEDKTRVLVLFHVMRFCTCMCARMCGSVCLSSNSHHLPPPVFTSPIQSHLQLWLG